MEGMIVIGFLFILSVYLLGYKKGKSDGEQHNREIIDYLESQLDKFYTVDNGDETRNDYWKRNFG